MSKQIAKLKPLTRLVVSCVLVCFGPLLFAEEKSTPKVPEALHSRPNSTAQKGLPPKSISEKAATKDGAPSGIVADESRDFQRASLLAEQGKESEALLSLADFLRRYPTSSLADDAQFLTGEVFYKQRKFSEAIAEFRKVFRYGMLNSERVPEAGVRIGESWYQLKKFDWARIEWEAVRRKYANSESAKRAQVLIAGLP